MKHWVGVPTRTITVKVDNGKRADSVFVCAKAKRQIQVKYTLWGVSIFLAFGFGFCFAKPLSPPDQWQRTWWGIDRGFVLPGLYGDYLIKAGIFPMSSAKDGCWWWSPCRSQECGESWWLYLWLSSFKGWRGWVQNSKQILRWVFKYFFLVKLSPMRYVPWATWSKVIHITRIFSSRGFR